MGYDFGARMYSAEIGRWMAPDPWEEDVSPYIYVGNDPVNFFDPNGKGKFGKWLKEKADDIGDAAKQVGNWVSEKADDAGDWIRGDAHNDIVNTTRWIPGFGMLQIQYLKNRNDGMTHNDALTNTWISADLAIGLDEIVPDVYKDEHEKLPKYDNSNEDGIVLDPSTLIASTDPTCIDVSDPPPPKGNGGTVVASEDEATTVDTPGFNQTLDYSPDLIFDSDYIIRPENLSPARDATAVAFSPSIFGSKDNLPDVWGMNDGLSVMQIIVPNEFLYRLNTVCSALEITQAIMSDNYVEAGWSVISVLGGEYTLAFKGLTEMYNSSYVQSGIAGVFYDNYQYNLRQYNLTSNEMYLERAIRYQKLMFKSYYNSIRPK